MVLWIDQNETATGLFEKVFKEKGLSFHTVSSVSDFSYLIQDLNPKVIVVDAATALKDVTAFRRQYEETRGFHGTPVILLNVLPGLDFIQNVAGELKGPLNPFQLPDLLNKMV